MQKHAPRNGVGRHRKQSVSPTTKGRVALVAVATGAVSTAGAGGVAVAEAQHAEVKQEPNIDLAANTGAALSSEAPQILAIAEFKPMANLTDQVTKAVQYNNERVAADNAARAPQTAKPAEGTFTSGFGPRWGSFHSGIDIANAVGTPILAVMDGTVIDSGPASGYGNWIRIKHEDGSISVYGHMETLDVAVGQHVTAGQKIAGMGNRGFSTGSHLHFEIHPSGQGAVDPVPWLAARGIHV
ncbi:M23 family metallopeptidase [Corynebacterium epidermidicanis]|uniref:Metalloendopeptidase-like membrane protein n=1 Tax=Corynebacterium epidermidicanis TaxID=1050174 RepID=A0A0G3GUZ6_9CORY|nr:M23 family metallopeptidase [Corynebacterium epidermidicanis]AKK02647.1 metalloendopeptidase-like membrane protein [Corynebacterium epidermidicanis]